MRPSHQDPGAQREERWKSQGRAKDEVIEPQIPMQVADLTWGTFQKGEVYGISSQKEVVLPLRGLGNVWQHLWLSQLRAWSV